MILYLYGVQDIDNAKNDDFLYETVNQEKVTKNYSFTITIESTPVGESEVEEVEE